MDKASDEKMVNTLITYRQKVVAIVRDCFGLDQSFVQAQSQAFEFFINKRENKPAEMMGSFYHFFATFEGGLIGLVSVAKYLDAKLRSGNKGMADEDLENTLKDVLALFRFTQGTSSHACQLKLVLTESFRSIGKDVRPAFLRYQ